MDWIAWAPECGSTFADLVSDDCFDSSLFAEDIIETEEQQQVERFLIFHLSHAGTAENNNSTFSVFHWIFLGLRNKRGGKIASMRIRFCSCNNRGSLFKNQTQSYSILVYKELIVHPQDSWYALRIQNKILITGDSFRLMLTSLMGCGGCFPAVNQANSTKGVGTYESLYLIGSRQQLSWL